MADTYLSTAIVIGQGPVMTYGTPAYSQAVRLGPETGAIRDMVSQATAKELARMMRAAVEDGTGRRTFHNAKEDPILSRLIIGGKSGTINNDAGQRVDWFVAWAKPRAGTGCQDMLAVSAVVVHSGQTTTTSQRLVRNALVAYYKDRLLGRRGAERAEITAPRKRGG